MLNMLKGAWNLFAGAGGRHEEPWATDEEAFGDHFGINYSDYADMVAGLDQAHVELYEKTMEINPEAAVAWVVFIAGQS